MPQSKGKIQYSLLRQPRRPAGTKTFKSKFKTQDRKLAYDKPRIGELFDLTADNLNFGRNIFDTIREIAEQNEIIPTDIGALNWYFATVYKFYNYSNFMRNKEMVASGRLTSYVPEPFGGRMLIFNYEPANTRQVYDAYPLVITTDRLRDGFMGFNLHYLSPEKRAIAFSFLLQSISSLKLEARSTRFRITQSLIKRRPRLYDMIEPCIRRYKYDRIKSRLLLCPPLDWGTALFLPFEDFKNESRMQVYRNTQLLSNKESYGIK
tara:strand:+ start:6073 stop:6864 length:792 start_codon:yes stop_codon:yes gene_type:complete